MGPFAAACELYWAAGWRGVLPLPARAKAPPPRGWTGRGAPYPSWADVRAWADGPEGEGNIALRLPDGLIGLDVDDYMDRAGGAHLDELTRELGPLPVTAISTARDNRSGIRLFTAPAGLRWPGQSAPGIEVIQAAHRYAVVWPSIHPELDMPYRWGGPPMFTGEVPSVAALPELPASWIEYLTGLVTSEEVTPAELDDGEASDWLAACRGGEPCPLLRETAARAVGALRARTVHGSRHELALEVSRTLAAYGGEGHAGVRVCLVALREAFLLAVSDDPKRDGGAEWSRMLYGAVRLAAAVNPTPLQICDCALRAGEGVQFDAAEPVNSQIDNGSVTMLIEADPYDRIVDLGPYLDGSYVAPEPAVGVERSDTRHLLYAGRWHTCVGLTASGKSWLALAHARDEMDRGKTVVYVHFEEASPAGMVARLRSMDVPAATILARFVWLSCDRMWTNGELAIYLERLAARDVVLVILDGINAACTNHGQNPKDPEAVGWYRNRFVTPATVRGAAVLSLGHPPKAQDRQDERHGFGSTAWLDEVDGVGFRLTAHRDHPIRRGAAGSARLHCVKDRYGSVERHGSTSHTREGWTYLGSLNVDDESVVTKVIVLAPKRDETSAAMAVGASAIAALADSIAAVLSAAPGQRFESQRKLIDLLKDAEIKFSHDDLGGALLRLQRYGRLERGPVGANGRCPGWLININFEPEQSVDDDLAA